MGRVMPIIRIASLGLVVLWAYAGSFCWGGVAIAGMLSDRLVQFPDWQGKPTLEAATGDLLYPAWMAGNWQVTSTLVDLVAPFAPKLETPGFAGNQKYLNQPVDFQVKFRAGNGAFWGLPVANFTTLQVVADRAFNGLQVSRAYLGDRVLSVRVKSRNPNEQITQIRNSDG